MLKAKAKAASDRITYDTAEHVAELRAMNITPHVAQYNSGSAKGRQSAIDRRTTRHAGYRMSQSCRAMIRVHLRVGQAARHDAKDQASRHRTRRRRLHSQPDRQQLDPHSQIDRSIVRASTPNLQEQSHAGQPNHPISWFFSKLLVHLTLEAVLRI
jgi:hypothetical protein